MAGERDHYRILGVSRNASTPEIRRAYRRLARQHHPDSGAQPGGTAPFRALADAYAVLNNPARRAHYDRATAPVKSPPLPRPRQAHSHTGGVLELSAHEAQLASTGPLVLTDHHGITLVLPTGVRDGDGVTLGVGSRTVILTVHVRLH